MTDKSQIIAQTLNINTPAIQTDVTAMYQTVILFVKERLNIS